MFKLSLNKMNSDLFRWALTHSSTSFEAKMFFDKFFSKKDIKSWNLSRKSFYSEIYDKKGLLRKVKFWKF